MGRPARSWVRGRLQLPAHPVGGEPLMLEHIKPRLLGHWGTTPGINFVYAHLNRIIIARDRNVLAIIGPGHGGPAPVANTYLEGSYTAMYPGIGPKNPGVQRLVQQLSVPRGVPRPLA